MGCGTIPVDAGIGTGSAWRMGISIAAMRDVLHDLGRLMMWEPSWGTGLPFAAILLVAFMVTLAAAQGVCPLVGMA